MTKIPRFSVVAPMLNEAGAVGAVGPEFCGASAPVGALAAKLVD
jgi:hypothetical protein